MSLKIAVASAGLGHVARGVEAWAADLGLALFRRGIDVALFQGAGQARHPWQKVLHCRGCFDPQMLKWVERLKGRGGWRYGLGSGVQAQETSFLLRLWPRVHRHYDILHVQDAWVAQVMEKLYRLRLSRPRVILAHGTNEPPAFLRQFSHLQHLSPSAEEQWRPHQPSRQQVFAIPNFVDTDRYRPGDRSAARQQWEFPRDVLLVLCVSAITVPVKRVDRVLREFAGFLKRSRLNAILVVAGSRNPDTDTVKRLGLELLGDRVRFFEHVSRDRMPTLYQTADFLCLGSEHEMLPVAGLEALASGLPIACNDTPVLRWVVGPAGFPSDLSRVGALAEQMERLASLSLRAELAGKARAHAVTTFSEHAVLLQIMDMYERVLVSDGRHGVPSENVVAAK